MSRNAGNLHYKMAAKAWDLFDPPQEASARTVSRDEVLGTFCLSGTTNSGTDIPRTKYARGVVGIPAVGVTPSMGPYSSMGIAEFTDWYFREHPDATYTGQRFPMAIRDDEDGRLLSWIDRLPQG